MMPRECPLSAYARGTKAEVGTKAQRGEGNAGGAGRESGIPDAPMFLPACPGQPGPRLLACLQPQRSAGPVFRISGALHPAAPASCDDEPDLKLSIPGWGLFLSWGVSTEAGTFPISRLEFAPDLSPIPLLPLEHPALEPVCDSGCRVPVRGFTAPRRQRRS